MSDVTGDNENFRNDDEVLSEEEVNHYLARFDSLEKDLEELDGANRLLLDAWREQLAGPHLEPMLGDQEETLRRLTDPSANLRRVAIHLAIDHWMLGELVADQCEEMAQTDLDPGVRETAVGGVGSCYLGTKNARISRVLARMIKDECQPDKVRTRAYTALVAVQGHSNYRGKRILEIHSPADFEWDFVEEHS
ncbi:MAG: hypothetical protein K2R98_22680 [Gemmataceae bacterium]|nr:hypothetical protein [Gemmataceae bacterium]